MELQENYAIFESLDTEIISIAQLERDPANLSRITEFVHNTFPIVADPKQITRKPYDIFAIYIIDKQGILRTHIPGTKEARPRLDIILTELAKLEGVEPPSFTDATGHIRVEGAASVASPDPEPFETIRTRWMWQYNQVRQGDRFKLAFIADIADGFHVYANDESRMVPFKITFELPIGLRIAGDLEYPGSTTLNDPILKIDMQTYTDVIAMPVIYFEATEQLEPGDYSVRATIEYQACNDTTCLIPATKTIEMPLKIVGPRAPRFGVAGSEHW